MPQSNLPAQLGLLFLAFAVPTLIVRATGAGWGTSAAFGQIAFVLAVTVVIVTARPKPPPADSG